MDFFGSRKSGTHARSNCCCAVVEVSMCSGAHWNKFGRVRDRNGKLKACGAYIAENCVASVHEIPAKVSVL